MGTYERLHSHASKPNGSSNTRMATNPDEIQAAMRSGDTKPLSDTTWEHVPTFGMKDYPHQYHATHSSKSKGVSILLHASLTVEILRVKTDSQGRYVMLQCLLNGSPGRPPWRLNDSLLHDHTFSQTLTDALCTYFQINDTPDIHPTTLWQAHKAVIRGLLISRASYVKKKAQEEYLNLLRTLRDATAANIMNPTPQQAQIIKDTTAHLNNIALAKTAHILHKLKQTSYSQGNRAGKHLATLLRQKQSNAKIPYYLQTKELKSTIHRTLTILWRHTTTHYTTSRTIQTYTNPPPQTYKTSSGKPHYRHFQLNKKQLYKTQSRHKKSNMPSNLSLTGSRQDLTA
ncbi:LINE-1 reverse transcriptase [Pelobates cultripes]|uniref:LINE-1 reverse transcriptase n=1 Tax=Pelobates cultripes TaxID=61616 RepID=A0AAD1S010_PELCU|nr:LINE-1 reverse transcriptase [Pelobates cultripes]